MIIALINWRIIPSEVESFLEEWMTKLPLNNAEGLIGEFLSKVEGTGFFSGITWEMEPDEKDDKAGWRSYNYVSYVNVGFWATKEDFMNAVGKYMSQGRSIVKPFEAAPRRRAILTPEAWRRGAINLPPETSPGVTP